MASHTPTRKTGTGSLDEPSRRTREKHAEEVESVSMMTAAHRQSQGRKRVADEEEGAPMWHKGIRLDI